MAGTSARAVDHEDSQSAASDLSTEAYHVGLKEDLLDALNSIQTSGSFAFFGALKEPPPAGLSVQDVGDITMPLTESVARELITKAKQAPFGKGSDTIVDTAVRNTWELDAGQFTFQNPLWPSYIQALCARVAKELGINATVTAEIYKMLIYEEGAMFKAHTDTEKIPGMFGTLIVCLPSAHQGGEVSLKHCGEKKLFKTSSAAQSYACWYSDVSHEVLPVTSGYRWVLTYNLAIDMAVPRPSAGLKRSETRDLRHSMRRWLSKPEGSREKKFVYHVLEHDYTEASISLKALKAQDLARVQVLKELTNEFPVEIFLALLEKEEMGNVAYEYDGRRGYGYGGYSRWDEEEGDSEGTEGGFHPLDEVFETKYRVKNLVDLEGRIVMHSLALDEEDILDSECFDDMIDGEEEYEGYMGNSGPTATHWYRLAAVAIVPRDSITTLFFHSGAPSGLFLPQANLPSQISYLARLCSQPIAPESLVASLIKLCESTWETERRDGFQAAPIIDGKSMSEILKFALQREMYAFFEKAASRHRRLFDPAFFSWTRQWLERSKEGFESRFKLVQKGLLSAVCAYQQFAMVFMALGRMAPISKEASAPTPIRTPEYVLKWVRSVLRKAVGKQANISLGKDDGPAMIDSAMYFEDPLKHLTDCVTPEIKGQSEAYAFWIAFLAHLRHQSLAGILPIDGSMQLYRTLAKTFSNVTDFTKLSTEADDLVAPLISKLIGNARNSPQLPVSEFHTLWLPFLRSLVPILVSNGIPLDAPRYRELFCTFLKVYVQLYVGREPQKDGSLRRQGLNCSCVDCTALNRFLVSSTERVGRIAVNKKRRQHLHQKLDAAGIDCTHVTARVGSPQSLVVTKTFRENDKQRQNWAARRARAEKELKLFDVGQLKQLLGSDYMSITNLSHLQAVPLAAAQPSATPTPSSTLATQPRRPLSEIGSSAVSRPSVSGVKRKLPPSEIEIIDLTSD
ncbi:hypothetical protein G7046_g3978 [Stylonectria norvegica]|nr:hypothetical protein G7046_g3978 [Stylonectria norvegica]